MVYTPPTPAQFKVRFPRFAAVADATVQAFLDRASGEVDDGWPDPQRAEGQGLYAAHLLTLEGLGTGAEAKEAAAGTLGYQQVTSGRLTVKKFDRRFGSTAEGDLMRSTSYGVAFLAEARKLGGGMIMTVPG